MDQDKRYIICFRQYQNKIMKGTGWRVMVTSRRLGLIVAKVTSGNQFRVIKMM